MYSVKEILKSEKWLSDIICKDLYESLKFYSDLRFRHQDDPEIEELCIDICNRIKEIIRWHQDYWLTMVKEIEVNPEDEERGN